MCQRRMLRCAQHDMVEAEHDMNNFWLFKLMR